MQALPEMFHWSNLEELGESPFGTNLMYTAGADPEFDRRGTLPHPPGFEVCVYTVGMQHQFYVCKHATA